MKVIGIIRQRGQLTIPDSIRNTVKWASPNSAVSINVIKPGEIVIRPQTAYIDWDEIWNGIQKAREITGKTKTVSAAEFLQKDRKSH